MSFIEFNNVKKVYKTGEVEVEAVKGVNFSIEKGELVIIVGASGAGKTTILNMLGGMDSVTDGEIKMNDSIISNYNRKQLINYRREDVGFVFQFYNLVQNLTTKENVELASQIVSKPLDEVEVLKQVGLTERMNNFPAQLSGGEQQRVAIARAIAKNPQLLLCDEPTGALDFKTGKNILKLLQDTSRIQGKTVVIITHNAAFEEIGDRVIRINSGTVVDEHTNSNPASAEGLVW
ncbi:ABC transporter ATP-binding protein [Companilactobacillus nuruki]|uniref:Macrolide ABC transporter ATP-binding protein n=1 Tax=Companilactobacillus nuruki TaxID=1993540 RepID=A0A2N7AVX2_9LACO|nr:ABC transporter ATP-binding protein [Companilactobacillus nuruki]PMD72295.1 macrolide ABC transporter ATP-binding protein [Companilactobacillus nuruki]